MSDREKKLLYFLLGALFLIGNFVAFNHFYSPKIAETSKRKAAAESEYFQQSTILERKTEWKKPIAWLLNAEGAPTDSPTAASKLQAFIKRSADRRGLVTKKETILGAVEGNHYHRVRVRYKVNGMEQQIQQWLLEIHRPNQLQVITKFDLQPQKNDITRADCEVEVERWFLPEEDTATL